MTGKNLAQITAVTWSGAAVAQVNPWLALAWAAVCSVLTIIL